MGHRQLTQDERYVMARLLRQGYGYRANALVLDRPVPTIKSGVSCASSASLGARGAEARPPEEDGREREHQRLDPAVPAQGHVHAVDFKPDSGWLRTEGGQRRDQMPR